MLETLDHSIRIGSTPTILYFHLYIQWQSKVVDNFFEDTFCGITF